MCRAWEELLGASGGEAGLARLDFQRWNRVL